MNTSETIKRRKNWKRRNLNYNTDTGVEVVE
jgi:hypothetical protein